jgi:hypothetical protein
MNRTAAARPTNRPTLTSTAFGLAVAIAGILTTLLYQSPASSPPSLTEAHPPAPRRALPPSGSSSAASFSAGFQGDDGGAAYEPDGEVNVDDGALPEGVTVFDAEYPGIANLDPDLLRALREATANAADDGIDIHVNSGWRSPEYQNQLLRDAVSRYGSEDEAARWVATADTSPHVSGDAVDVAPADAAAWLSEHGATYGLCQIYRNEPWHYELRPGATGRGCPRMYADPPHDPRMQQ